MTRHAGWLCQPAAMFPFKLLSAPATRGFEDGTK